MMNLALDYRVPYGSLSINTAMSEEAMYLKRVEHDAVNSAERSQALFGDKAEAIQQLAELYLECSTADWDGYDASPIPLAARDCAVAIIRTLPNQIPIPEFSAEPDGFISLDWIVSRNNVFSLSVGSTDRLSYAWLDGAEQGYAVAVFDGEEIPQRILEGIKGIVRRE